MDRANTCWDSQGSAQPQSPPAPEAPASVDSLSNLIIQARRCVQNNRYKDAEELVMAHPELVKMADEHGNTLLTIASQNNRKRFVKLFLRHGADIDAQNAQGNSALHYCSAYNFNEVSDYLISKGANPAVRNRSQLLPSQMSTQNISSKMLDLPSKSLFQDSLAVSRGPPPNAPGVGALSPPSSPMSPPPISRRPPPSPLQSEMSQRPPRTVNPGPPLNDTMSRMSSVPSHTMSMQPPPRAATTSSKCVIGGVGNNVATSMITRTAVPIFHGSNQTPIPAEHEEEVKIPARPMQYPSYRLPDGSVKEKDRRQANKASENLKSTAVPVFHFQDI